jgi:hypothetical protein
VSAIVVGWSRQRETTRAWASGSARYLREWRSQPRSFVLSVVVWTVLIAGIVGWDLVSFIHQSHSLPTLSYFIGHVTRYRIGRGLLFALWLMAGWYLVSAWRARASR